MLVRMKVGLSGPAYSLSPGQERDFPDDEAIRLIGAGYAIPVTAIPVEVAVKPPAEEARPKMRRGRNADARNATGG